MSKKLLQAKRTKTRAFSVIGLTAVVLLGGYIIVKGGTSVYKGSVASVPSCTNDSQCSANQTCRIRIPDSRRDGTPISIQQRQFAANEAKKCASKVPTFGPCEYSTQCVSGQCMNHRCAASQDECDVVSDNECSSDKTCRTRIPDSTSDGTPIPIDGRNFDQEGPAKCYPKVDRLGPCAYSHNCRTNICLSLGDGGDRRCGSSGDTAQGLGIEIASKRRARNPDREQGPGNARGR